MSELKLTQVEPPRPINPSGKPCASCGNVYIHAAHCPVQPSLREQLRLR